MKIYIAGPMSGYPRFNYPAFNFVAKAFRQFGVEVENPAETDLDPVVNHREDFLKEGLIRMLDCDVVAFLPGWEMSGGARLEYSTAKAVSIPRVMWNDLYQALEKTYNPIDDLNWLREVEL